jgi:DnaJ-class molecular chaperone
MASRERRDPYLVLGVPRQASGEEIARAFRRAARASHPDSDDAGSAERFQVVSDAYEVLRDPRRRAMYDRSRPPGRSGIAGARVGSVGYLAPGSQHLVLGRPAPARFEATGPSAGDIEAMFRIALSLLRANW